MGSGTDLYWKNRKAKPYTEVLPRVYHVNMKDQETLARCFCRFQEHFESPKFRGKVFTLGEFREWYKESQGEDGQFSYYQDWNGFNIPSYVFDAFKRGLFDPLTEDEQYLLNLFKDKDYEFYVIGTHSGDDKESLRHEMCHALYYLNSEYKKEVQEYLVNFDLRKLNKWLLEMGYCEEVLLDECHAYLASDSTYLKKDHGIVIKGNPERGLKKIREFYGIT